MEKYLNFIFASDLNTSVTLTVSLPRLILCYVIVLVRPTTNSLHGVVLFVSENWALDLRITKHQRS